MISLEEYQALQRIITKLERQRDELAGEIKQIEKELKREYGCNNLDEAKILLAKMEKDYERKELQFRKKLGSFLAKHRKSVRKIAREDYELLAKFVFNGKEFTKRKKKRKRTKEEN
jgi:hypothetical protein